MIVMPLRIVKSQWLFYVLFSPPAAQHLCSMDNNIITIKEMLQHIHSGKPFSMIVVSYDRNRKRGGSLKTYLEARLLRRGDQEKAKGRKLTPVEGGSKKSRQNELYTRTILLMQNGQDTSLKRDIHPPLVFKFNNKTVVP